MCRITFTLHVYDLTFIMISGGDGGGVTSEKRAAKPVKAVQDCLSTFASIFKETLGQFPSKSGVS